MGRRGTKRRGEGREGNRRKEVGGKRIRWGWKRLIIERYGTSC